MVRLNAVILPLFKWIQFTKGSRSYTRHKGDDIVCRYNMLRQGILAVLGFTGAIP